MAIFGAKNTLLREKAKFFEIIFSLKGPFGGQKESFKAILGPILGFFYCYYSWLPWPDPKRPNGSRGPTPNAPNVLASPFITFLYYRNYIRLLIFCSTNTDKLISYIPTKLSGKERHTFIIIFCIHNIDGFVEPKTASNAINCGVVNRFIEKSLDINEIKQAVAIAIGRYEINVESKIARMSIFQHRAVFSFQQ